MNEIKTSFPNPLVPCKRNGERLHGISKLNYPYSSKCFQDWFRQGIRYFNDGYNICRIRKIVPCGDVRERIVINGDIPF